MRQDSVFILRLKKYVPKDLAILGGAFFGAMFFCAGLYFAGVKLGWGTIQVTFEQTSLQNTNVPANPHASEIGFWDCLYFSAITITTVGYGDYRPVSFGRIVAATEAILGLVLMGVLIARLVSRRQDRLMKRLVTGQLNSEIQRHRTILENLLKEFKAYELRRTAEGGLYPGDEEITSNLLYRAGGLAKAIARFWRYESRSSDLSDVIQERAASRLLGNELDLLNCVERMVRGKTRNELKHQDLSSTRNIVKSVQDVANIISRVGTSGANHLSDDIHSLGAAIWQQLQLTNTRPTKAKMPS